jgi:hypothetical protein
MGNARARKIPAQLVEDEDYQLRHERVAGIDIAKAKADVCTRLPRSVRAGGGRRGWRRSPRGRRRSWRWRSGCSPTGSSWWSWNRRITGGSGTTCWRPPGWLCSWPTPRTLGSWPGGLRPTGSTPSCNPSSRLTCPSVPAPEPHHLTSSPASRQRAFAPGHQARYPASHAAPPAEHRALRRGFPAAFRPPASASRASCPARGFRSSYDRPTAPHPARTRAGFPCSARVRHGWGRVPSLPRGLRCLSRPVNLPDRRMPPSSGRSLFTPVQHSAPGCNCDEASSRVHRRSPLPAFPSPVIPDGTGTPGLFPELRTRLSRIQPRTSGRERASGTARSHVISIR